MLKKLRARFVAVIMIIVTVTLCLVFGMLYHFTQENMENESIRMMQSIGEKPFQPARPGEPSGDFRLPCFTLQIGSQGELTATGDGYFDLSDEAFLRELLEAADKSGGQTGVLREYNLRFCRTAAPDGQRLVFADISSEQSILRNLAETCLGLGILCFVVFLGISVFLAVWMVKPVEKAWQQQRQFVADASHELKTPLTVIIANAEMLQSPDYDAESKARFSGGILTMSRQMRVLVERLLDLARSDSEQWKMTVSTVDFSSLTEKALLPFEPLIFEKGLSLSSRIQSGVTVSGSRQHLGQLVDILLDNAQKYALPQGEISVCLEKVNRHLSRLTVSNPAEAISGEELKNIFKRFYRVDKARSRDGGFGLGLSIAESIVQAHHGRIWAEHKNGRITFFVELPVTAQAQADTNGLSNTKT